MSSTTLPVVPIDSRKVVIEGLEKIQDAKQINSTGTSDGEKTSSTFSTIMHGDQPLSELWTRIADCGFHKPVVINTHNARYREDEHLRVVSDHEEVVVVADDQMSTKNTIRITESLISHANAHHGEPIGFNITPLPSSKRAIEANCGFHMSLERTPRMPDDNKLHQLPGSLGSYDLFSVESYADRLPNEIRDSGGVFFPMWQREAMWLNFEPTKRKCAVRIFMGHVNAISGLTMEETTNNESEELEQDYIVIPGQRWLDGICVAPGIVRQFVAMPLGSGYTVEGQKTSKEQHGGLQLQITPECVPQQRLWSYSKKTFLKRYGQGLLDSLYETMTPQQLRCNLGDVLRSYPADRASEEPLKIKHLANSRETITCTDIYKDPYPPVAWNHAAARILHIHILDPVSCEQVTHIVPTPPSTDVKAYTEAGGKYFVVEEKVDERLDGGDFDNVKSVGQMDQHIGISTEPEFDPTKPKIIRPCDHQFCNICIKRIEQNSDEDVNSARRNWKCPTCDSVVSHVAGFSAPMNLPSEEPLRIKVPVNVLKIEDGRIRFTSVQRSRV
ncbi:hypothetical protein J4E90_001586 [Alternaria incomplexa]|uniref:uncharacterized protein n=1 Tax=Alternaria incomplexa TaxID=1187928 RepID=UPI002220D2DD|nr:uncharacterized protein J4E90_001586 [Alternaria incomplexa]KAI4919452.1 hypothetical protein J4E90_001586 [Alternaria incomplexa]